MGRIHQVNVSNGGVPKLPIPRGSIDENGVVGDVQADRVHHGHPDQALCLYSLEVIRDLQEEGHAISPGSAGENITVAGIDWSLVVPGVRMALGPAQVEITHFATPCAKNARWFSDGNYNRIHPNEHPGESRVYARVLEGGPVEAGDEVSLID